MSAADGLDVNEVLAQLGRALETGPADRGDALRAARVRLPARARPLDLRAGFVEQAAALPADRFYWSRPADGFALLGVGARAVVETRGPDRFREAAAAAQRLFASLPVFGSHEREGGEVGGAGRGPLLVGGFSFAASPPSDGVWRGFPPARLVLPEVTVVRRGDEAWLSLVFAPVLEPGPEGRLAPALLRVRRLLEALFGSESAAPARGLDCGFEREGPVGMTRGPEYRVRADRSHADYRAQVSSARRAIAAGDFEKVVLARTLSVRHEGRFDRGGLLRRLEGLYPDCVTFAVARGDACFLGATPELLVARAGPRVRSGAVAGSAPRGRTPEEDARLGRALLESKKDQEEHAFVVRAVSEALAPVCRDLEVLEAPRLMRIEGIQHLETPILGRLQETPGDGSSAAGRWPSLLALAGRLHPTPAVAGAPRQPALAWIERCEGLDRGWYAGPVGFVDAAGDGELRVALRSGLLRAARPEACDVPDAPGFEEALLFSGGGIVADSHPEQELEETRIKLRALLAPLTEI